MKMIASLKNCEFRMTRAQAARVVYSEKTGQDVHKLAQEKAIAGQLNRLGVNGIKEALMGYKMFNHDLDNHKANRIRLVWVAGYHIIKKANKDLYRPL
jgi:hypothetical protein